MAVGQVSDDISFFQINEFVKRARAAKIHAYIISHLKKEMPAMMGKAKAQQRLIDNLADEFGKVSSLSPSLSMYLNMLGIFCIRYICGMFLILVSAGPKGVPFASR